MIKEELEILTGAQNQEELKKAYLTLVKKYHPDRARECDKERYNEYLTLINRVYGELRTAADIKAAAAQKAAAESQRFQREYIIKYRGAVIATKDWEDVLLKTGHDMISTAYDQIHALFGRRKSEEDVASAVQLATKATEQFQKVLKESRNSYYLQIANQMMQYYVWEFNKYLCRWYCKDA